MSETIEQVHTRWLQMRKDSADHDGGYPATDAGRWQSQMDHVRLAEAYGPLLAEVARLKTELRLRTCEAVSKANRDEELRTAYAESQAENARLREGVEGLAKWLHTRAYLCYDCDGATHCELLVAETRVRHLLVDTAAALAGKEGE